MKTKQVIYNLGKIIKIVISHNLPYLLFSLLQIVTSIIQPFIGIVLVKYILDAILERATWDTFITLLVAMLVFKLFNDNLNTVSNKFTKLYAKNQMIPMSIMFCRKAIEMDFKSIEDPQIVNEINRATNVLLNKDNLEIYLGSINGILISLGQLVITMFLVGNMDIFVLMVIGTVTIINYLINLICQKKNFYMQTKLAPVDRMWKYLNKLTSDSSFGKSIRIDQLNSFFTRKMKENRQCYLNIKKNILQREYIGSVLTNVLTLAEESVMFLWLVLSGISRGLTIGDFTVLFNASQQLTSSFTALSTEFLNLYKNDNYINDFFTLLNRKNSLRKENGLHIALNQVIGLIEFDNVSFKYPNSEKNTINKLNLCISPGEHLTIVGENGAGKTTLIKLLMRLYDVSEGEIRYNGVNIKEYDYNDYMGIIATMFQDYQIFASSVYENIALCEKESINKESINKILQQYGLLQKISGMANGGETILSNIYEKDGQELSGGQMQLIALARVIYKNSPIVILDEPAASLSPMSEYNLYKHLTDLAKNKTAIYISHRLSSAKISNKICVIQDGTVAEYGTHDDLIRQHGIYYRMFSTQAKYYQ